MQITAILARKSFQQQKNLKCDLMLKFWSLNHLGLQSQSDSAKRLQRKKPKSSKLSYIKANWIINQIRQTSSVDSIHWTGRATLSVNKRLPYHAYLADKLFKLNLSSSFKVRSSKEWLMQSSKEVQTALSFETSIDPFWITQFVTFCSNFGFN